MSQLICISLLEESQRAAIAQELTFYPVEEKPKYQKQQYRTIQGKGVYAFMKDNDIPQRQLKTKKKAVAGNTLPATAIKEGDPTLLRVPFQYAVKKFGTCNDKLAHKRIDIKPQPGMQLNEMQKADANKVLQELKLKRSCTLCLRAGGGKTASSCIISTAVKLFTVVLVENTILLPQWEGEFKKFTTAVTHIVDDKTPIPENVDVLICHILRYDLIPRAIRDQVGFVIVDESPLLCNQPGANALLGFTPKFMLACSATPSRSRDQMYVVMNAFMGEAEVRNKQKRHVEVTRIKTVYQGEKVRGAGGRLVWATYIQSILYNMERNEQIINGVLEDIKTGRKILVLTTEKKHVTLLHEMLLDSGVDADWLSGSKKSYNNCQVLVGNTQKCGVGFDDANFCSNFDGTRISIVWIVSEIGNKEMAEQVIGRARANDPWVRQVVDDEPMSERHWQLCRGVYVTNGAEIKHLKWNAFGDDV